MKIKPSRWSEPSSLIKPDAQTLSLRETTLNLLRKMVLLLSEMEEYVLLRATSHLKLIFSEESLKKKLKLKIQIPPTISLKNKSPANLEIIEDNKSLEDKAIANKEATEDQEENTMVIENLEENKVIDHQEEKKVVKEETMIMIENLKEHKEIDHQEEKKAVKEETMITTEDLEEKMETETTSQELNGLRSVL